MSPLDLNPIQDLIARAFREDVGDGDVTSEALVAASARARAALVAREETVVAGLPVAERVFLMASPDVRFEAALSDGDRAAIGAVLARVEGPARALLCAERLALNFLQRLCGIAALTRRCVEAAGAARPVKIMDTRKTTPCWRLLEKYAVRCGGGVNHRMGLYDQVLIKDNHLRLFAAQGEPDAAARAVVEARAAVGPEAPIEVEAETPEQAVQAVRAGADIVMLDNMPPAQVREAVRLIRAAVTEGRRVEIEVSGGVRPEDVPLFAAAGVDRISLGCLTHSARAADISLEFE